MEDKLFTDLEGMVDLHVHSTCSDGSFSPEEVVDLAHDKGLKAIALTDHDTFSGIERAKNRACEVGLELIPGCELACDYKDGEIHIVGLFLDIQDQHMKKILEEMNEEREARNRKMALRFADYGIMVDYDEMIEIYKGAVITRANFADYIVKKGYVNTKKEVFRNYLADNKPCYIPRVKIDAVKGIEIIRHNGGLAVLAHPLLYKKDDQELRDMMKALKTAGISAVEAIYSTHKEKDQIYVKELADEMGLLISGGSDFHGANKPDIDLGVGKGNMRVPVSVLDALKECHRQLK